MNMVKNIISLGLMLSCLILAAQEKTPLELMVEVNRQEWGSFEMYPNIFKSSHKSSTVSRQFVNEKEVSYLSYDPVILDMDLKTFSLEIPKSNGNIIIDLVEVPESFYDYEINTSSGKKYTGHDFKGKHFRGVVRGKKKSLAAISFYENNVMGIVSIRGEGNYNLGKLKNSDTHIFYSDTNLKKTFNFECGTQTDVLPDNRAAELFSSEKMTSPDKCVRLYIEVAEDIHETYGNLLSNTQAVVTGLYNQVAILFQNENITTEFSMFIWEEADPYSAADNRDTLLSLFQAQKNVTPFDADLGQLITYRITDGGLAATVDEYMCNPLTFNRVCVSGLVENFFTTSVPVYSWNVNIMTHEFGHLLGSPHTHDCSWGEYNNTPIDNCGAETGCWSNGSIVIGPTPQEGGTIMSYCHLLPEVGMNFTFGFGQEPGDLIRDNIANASCLTACSDNCLDTLLLFVEVHSGNTSEQEANTNISATNTINNGAVAIYHAGESILLKEGFKGLLDSKFKAYIEGCADNFQAKRVENTANEMFFISELKTIKAIPSIEVYPNPNAGIFTLLIAGVNEAFITEVYNFDGRKVFSQKIEEGNEKIILDISKELPSIYLVKVTANGIVYTKKVIKN